MHCCALLWIHRVAVDKMATASASTLPRGLAARHVLVDITSKDEVPRKRLRAQQARSIAAGSSSTRPDDASSASVGSADGATSAARAAGRVESKEASLYGGMDKAHRAVHKENPPMMSVWATIR